MASFIEKSKLPVGASESHRHPMHNFHLTTQNFMQFDIAFAKEFPKHHVKFNHQSFMRTMPMKKPIMSSIIMHKSAYFVPFRTVWEPFTEFKTDSPSVQSEGSQILTNVPLISNNTLIEWMVSNCLEPGTYTQSTSDFFIYREIGGVPSPLYAKFNAYGRHCYKILVALGMRPKFRSYDFTHDEDYTVSALPLLCAAKVYMDYFYPVQYAKTGNYITLEGIFNRRFIYTLSAADLTAIFRTIYLVSYSSDYFVSAFDNPVSGNTGCTSDIDIVDASLFNNNGVSPSFSSRIEADSNSNHTPYWQSADKTRVFTQYSDDLLKATTNYIRRHQLSSSRSLERYLADWGVALSADKLRRCYKLGEKHYPLQVGDVMASADTLQTIDDEQIGSQLGDYAGKGVAYCQDFDFESESDEFGYLLVISTVVPDIAYYQGVDRNVLHKTKFDFLTGDYDGVLITPIEQQELFVGNYRESYPESIFGFLPAYAEYATVKDIVSGDFTLNSINVGLLGWSTVREFSDKVSDSQFDVVHNLNFVIANDFDQYNRIFLSEEDDSDKFIVAHRGNFEAFMSKKPLYDYVDFGDIEGKEITMQVNGVKSN